MEQDVKNYGIHQNIKAHLMYMKISDGKIFFQAVEYCKPAGGSERGMIYYLEKNEEEALSIINYCYF